MKWMAAVPMLAAVLLAGCSSVLSVHPLYTDGTPVMEPGLAGIWEPDDGTDVWVVREKDDGYSLTTAAAKDGKVQSYDVRLVRLGGSLFADCVSRQGNNDTGITGHALGAVALEGGKLKVAAPDADWLAKDRPGFPLPAHSMPDGNKGPLVFTAPTPEIQAFLLRCAATPGCFGDPVTLNRLK